MQTIGLYPSGAVWTDGAANLSRLDPSGAYWIDAEHPARNRKVVGSNPISGSKTAVQRRFPALLTAQPQESVIPLGLDLASQARPTHFARGRCAARFPAGLSLGPESGWVYGQAPSRVRLRGVASGVTRKRHSTLGRAEFLVDDLQRSFHRVGTEATDAVVKWMVEELQEEQHRHDHRDHGPHE
jgi:hypothetical protein